MPGDVNFLVRQLSVSIVTASQIASWTEKDVVMSRVHHFILHGWPDRCPDPSFQPFYTRRDELSTVDGCILWGAKVVVPAAGRQIVLQQLHDTHPGINRMKSLARSYVWWPGLDADIQSTVQKCDVCQSNKGNPQKLHFTLGNGLHDHGHDFTLTMLVLSMGNYS